MAVAQKWQYRVCVCHFRTTREGGIFRPDEGYWTLALDSDIPLTDDSEMPITEGLLQMGEEGYELVGIQTSGVRDNGGAGTSWYAPVSIYIFKRPSES